MAALALAGLIVALGAVQDRPAPQDRWVSADSPSRMIEDPCDPTLEGGAGVSESWMRVVMLALGHPRGLVCGVRTDFDPQTIAAAEADLLDLGAQVTARALVIIGSTSRPLDDDGSWGEKSEAGSRALYLHLKADNYRALRELQTLESAAPPAPQ